MTAHWVGRCAGCNAWGTVEAVAAPAAQRDRCSVKAAVPLASVDIGPTRCRSTGVAELDRVLGGGLIPGSVTLLGGEPGIGKSTLVLQLLVALSLRGETCLLVCAEESAAQVRLRAARLGPLPDELLVLPDTSLHAVMAAVDVVSPAVVVVDSIQTLADADVTAAPGSVMQVRACAHALTRLAKDRDVSVVMVGHVTKDGALAGPRALEHVVDTVLSFEGDRHHALRLLRAVKHRFGPTGELGVFEMTDRGMREVADASGLFLGDRRVGAPGSAIVSALEGRRPLLVEVQALVANGRSAAPGVAPPAGPGHGAGPGASGGSWRRSAQGIDGGRLAQLLAVTELAAGTRFGAADVFVSAVGGVRLTEPAADLGIAIALVSAAEQIPVAADVVALGEIGLGGEVRQVPHTGHRLAEAARHGFGTALVPASTPDGASGLRLIRVETVGDAVAYLRRRPAAVRDATLAG